jgi:hypothetical protein
MEGGLMPEAIATALYYAFGSAAFGWGAAYTIAWAVTIAATVEYSKSQKRRAEARARAAANASAKDRELMLRSAVAPRRFIYGRDKVSGPVIYMQSTGAKKEFLHIVIALAAHECDAVEEIYFNDILLPALDVDGFVTSGEFVGATTNEITVYQGTTDGAGSITLPHNAVDIQAAFSQVGTGIGADAEQINYSGYAHTGGSDTVTGLPADTALSITYTRTIAGLPKVRVRAYLGAAGQTADADLITESGGLWTTDHIGAGICYLYVRLEFDQDVFGSVGVPNVSAVVRGKKVYDPRTDTTVWSNNAALCVADFLKSSEGLRATDTEVPDSEVITAANICDEEIDLSMDDEDTQLRYTADTSFTTEMSPLDVLSDLEQCMAGRAVWTQGRWLVRAGAYRTPTLTIDVNTLGPGTVTVAPRASRSDLFNAVRTRHRDPSQQYAEVQAPLVENSQYEDEDGGVQIVRQMDTPTLADTYRAQRLAKIELERARQALTVHLTCNLRAYDLAPTDTVMLTLAQYGFNAKVFEVVDRSLTMGGLLQYTLRETAAGVWEWNFGEATVGDLAPNTELPNPYTPPAALTGLTVTSQAVLASDGTVVLQALLEWDESEDAFVRNGGHIDVQWARASLEAIAAFAVPGTATSATVGPLVGEVAYIARVRQVNAVGRSGPWTYVNWIAQQDFTPPEDVTNLDWVIKPFQVQITCDPCIALDYAETELRFMLTVPDYDSTDWDAATFLVSGKSNEYHHPRPPNGTYYVLAKHRDTSGNYSENPAYITVIVDDSIDGGGGGTLRLTTDRFPFFAFSTGTTHTAIAPGDTPITFTALLFGLFGTASFTAEAFDNRIGGSSLGSVTLGGSGNTRTMTAAQFTAPGTSGSVERVRVTATLSSANDFIDVYRQDPTTTAPFLFLSNPQHQVPTDESGEFGDYSDANTLAVVYEGITDTTDDWDYSITPDSGVTATINGVSGPVSNPATVTVAVSNMTVTTGVVLITATQSGESDLTATFLVDKQEASGSGYVFYFTPREEINLPVNESGAVITYEDAFSELKIIKGGTLDDTANWSLSKEDINVISTLTGALVEVTAFVDPGAVGTRQSFSMPNAATAGWPAQYFDVIYADGVYLGFCGHSSGTWTGVLRSTDFETWTVVNASAAGRWARVAYDQGGWVMADSGSGTGHIGTVQHSTDGGLTWAAVSLPSTLYSISGRIASGGGKILLAGQSTGGYQSSNGGATWSSITFPGSTCEGLYYVLSTWYYVKWSDQTVHRSTNGGSSWTDETSDWPLESGLAATTKLPARMIEFKGRAVAVLYGLGNKARYRDVGGQWVTVTLPITLIVIPELVIIGDVLWMVVAATVSAYTLDGKVWHASENVSPNGYDIGVITSETLDLNYIPTFSRTIPAAYKWPLESTSGTEGAVRVTASKPGALDIVASLPVHKGGAQKSNYAFSARPAALSLPATSDGVVTDFTNATMQFFAQKDGVDDTSNWTWTWTSTNLTPSSGSGSSATFTAMDSAQDLGTVTVTFTKAGEVQHRETLLISKNKGSEKSGPRPDVAYRAVSNDTTYIALRFAANGKVQIKRTSGGSWEDYTQWSGFIGTQPITYYLNFIPDPAFHALTSGTANTWLALTTDRDFVLSDAASGTHRVPFDVFIGTSNVGANSTWGLGELRLVVP